MACVLCSRMKDSVYMIYNYNYNYIMAPQRAIYREVGAAAWMNGLWD